MEEACDDCISGCDDCISSWLIADVTGTCLVELPGVEVRGDPGLLTDL